MVRVTALCAALLAAPLPDWTLGPFLRPAGVNPVLSPRPASRFACPMRRRAVAWEALHTFNPAAVVRDGKVFVLYRAEDDTGRGIGGHTSRLGLAWSADGLHFERAAQPVLYPAADPQARYEWDGGCEDPRLVETDDGRYVLTYTQWDRKTPRLAVATSRDLVHWVKHGPAFAHGRHRDRASKSGAIVTRRDGDHLRAVRIGGRYWMYWGEGGVSAAWSDDLTDWTVLEDARGEPAVVLEARQGRFDAGLAEGGPPAVLTPRGILVVYNGKDAAGAYAGGQALFDAVHPTRLLARLEEPFFRPELAFERTGQYAAGTTFLEGLVHFGGRWLLYYGCADSRVAVAECADRQGRDAPRVVRGQPAWVLASDQVELAVTRAGAQMAPVTFYRRDAHPVEPYYVSPWQGEGLPSFDCPVLAPLRGDFFCLPFGGNGTAYRGEHHPPHGETAGADWTLVAARREGPVKSLTLELATRVRPGVVTRTLALVDGQNAVYDRTVIRGFAGPASMAHHAILAPPRRGSLAISTAPFRFGMTAPYVFSDPARGEHGALAIGARFADLAQVPARDGGLADCSWFPARHGFADLVETFASPARTIDWFAAVNAESGWLFYALKDPRVLPGRVFWMEDHGRERAPWNGRNACLGIEDACAFFDAGLAESAAPNAISAEGIPTCHRLDGSAPFTVSYIEGVVRVPRRFGRVVEARFAPDAATFISASGLRAVAHVDTGFLWRSSW